MTMNTGDSTPLRFLLLEDSKDDAELNRRALSQAGIQFEWDRVDTRDDFVAALDAFRPDLILADYSLPGFDGLEALALTRQMLADVPFIFVTGQMGEERAVESLKQGATDYILKDRIARLPAAVNQALFIRAEQHRRASAERALRNSETLLRLAESTAHVGVWEWDLITDAMTWTVEMDKLHGYESGEFGGLGAGFAERVYPADRAEREAYLQQAITERQPFDFDYRIQLPRGELRWVNCKGAAHYNDAGQADRLFGVIIDITDRKAKENQIAQLNRTLRTIMVCNENLAKAKSEASLYREICRILVEVGSYRLALVAYPAAEGEGVDSVAQAGEASLFQLVAANLADRESPAQQVWREGRPLTITKAIVGAWAALADWVGAAVIPITLNDERLGILVVFPMQGHVLDGDELTLLASLASDLAYGIISMRSQEERDQYLARFGKAMRDSALALAGVLEIRDPYTAGHQRRVAAIAVAIARHMGLDERLIEGLYFGGMIHDIGKVGIPAEILCKPSRLTDTEMKLVQEHAKVGFDIVQHVEFPWPVAQMVLQHHERMDGSGYPNGLKGGAILLEARILAVADVVEAMASHRPYRPGLGIDQAIDEITRYRDSRYDPQVVDACLAVVRSNGMALPA